jgi:hypothetical protein
MFGGEINDDAGAEGHGEPRQKPARGHFLCRPCAQPRRKGKLNTGRRGTESAARAVNRPGSDACPRAACRL